MQATNRNRKRSSILKKATFEVDETTTQPISLTKPQKRISFSGKKSVKEFHQAADAGTIWGTSYEESASSESLHSTKNDANSKNTSKTLVYEAVGEFEKSILQTRTLRNRKVEYQSSIPVATEMFRNRSKALQPGNMNRNDEQLAINSELDKENIFYDPTLRTSENYDEEQSPSLQGSYTLPINRTINITLDSYEIRKLKKINHNLVEKRKESIDMDISGVTEFEHIIEDSIKDFNQEIYAGENQSRILEQQNVRENSIMEIEEPLEKQRKTTVQHLEMESATYTTIECVKSAKQRIQTTNNDSVMELSSLDTKCPIQSSVYRKTTDFKDQNIDLIEETSQLHKETMIQKGNQAGADAFRLTNLKNLLQTSQTKEDLIMELSQTTIMENIEDQQSGIKNPSESGPSSLSQVRNRQTEFYNENLNIDNSLNQEEPVKLKLPGKNKYPSERRQTIISNETCDISNISEDGNAQNRLKNREPFGKEGKSSSSIPRKRETEFYNENLNIDNSLNQEKPVELNLPGQNKYPSERRQTIISNETCDISNISEDGNAQNCLKNREPFGKEGKSSSSIPRKRETEFYNENLNIDNSLNQEEPVELKLPGKNSERRQTIISNETCDISNISEDGNAQNRLKNREPFGKEGKSSSSIPRKRQTEFYNENLNIDNSLNQEEPVKLKLPGKNKYPSERRQTIISNETCDISNISEDGNAQNRLKNREPFGKEGKSSSSIPRKRQTEFYNENLNIDNSLNQEKPVELKLPGKNSERRQTIISNETCDISKTSEDGNAQNRLKNREPFGKEGKSSSSIPRKRETEFYNENLDIDNSLNQEEPVELKLPGKNSERRQTIISNETCDISNISEDGNAQNCLKNREPFGKEGKSSSSIPRKRQTEFYNENLNIDNSLNQEKPVELKLPGKNSERRQTIISNETCDISNTSEDGNAQNRLKNREPFGKEGKSSSSIPRKRETEFYNENLDIDNSLNQEEPVELKLPGKNKYPSERRQTIISNETCDISNISEDGNAQNRLKNREPFGKEGKSSSSIPRKRQTEFYNENLNIDNSLNQEKPVELKLPGKNSERRQTIISNETCDISNISEDGNAQNCLKNREPFGKEGKSSSSIPRKRQTEFYNENLNIDNSLNQEKPVELKLPGKNSERRQTIISNETCDISNISEDDNSQNRVKKREAFGKERSTSFTIPGKRQTEFYNENLNIDNSLNSEDELKLPNDKKDPPEGRQTIILNQSCDIVNMRDVSNDLLYHPEKQTINETTGKMIQKPLFKNNRQTIIFNQNNSLDMSTTDITNPSCTAMQNVKRNSTILKGDLTTSNVTQHWASNQREKITEKIQKTAVIPKKRNTIIFDKNNCIEIENTVPASILGRRTATPTNSPSMFVLKKKQKKNELHLPFDASLENHSSINAVKEMKSNEINFTPVAVAVENSHRNMKFAQEPNRTRDEMKQSKNIVRCLQNSKIIDVHSSAMKIDENIPFENSNRLRENVLGALPIEDKYCYRASGDNTTEKISRFRAQDSFLLYNTLHSKNVHGNYELSGTNNTEELCNIDPSLQEREENFLLTNSTELSDTLASIFRRNQRDICNLTLATLSDDIEDMDIKLVESSNLSVGSEAPIDPARCVPPSNGALLPVDRTFLIIPASKRSLIPISNTSNHGNLSNRTPSPVQRMHFITPTRIPIRMKSSVEKNLIKKQEQHQIPERIASFVDGKEISLTDDGHSSFYVSRTFCEAIKAAKSKPRKPQIDVRQYNKIKELPTLRDVLDANERRRESLSVCGRSLEISPILPFPATPSIVFLLENKIKEKYAMILDTDLDFEPKFFFPLTRSYAFLLNNKIATEKLKWEISTTFFQQGTIIAYHKLIYCCRLTFNFKTNSRTSNVCFENITFSNHQKNPDETELLLINELEWKIPANATCMWRPGESLFNFLDRLDREFFQEVGLMVKRLQKILLITGSTSNLCGRNKKVYIKKFLSYNEDKVFRRKPIYIFIETKLSEISYQNVQIPEDFKFKDTKNLPIGLEFVEEFLKDPFTFVMLKGK